MRNKLADAVDCLQNFIKADESKAVAAEVAALIKAVHRNGVTVGDKAGEFTVVSVTYGCVIASSPNWAAPHSFTYAEWRKFVSDNMRQKGKRK